MLRTHQDVTCVIIVLDKQIDNRKVELLTENRRNVGLFKTNFPKIKNVVQIFLLPRIPVIGMKQTENFRPASDKG